MPPRRVHLLLADFVAMLLLAAPAALPSHYATALKIIGLKMNPPPTTRSGNPTDLPAQVSP